MAERFEGGYEFGPFRLEPAKRRLLREGEPLALTPKAFDTLVLLVENRERVVEKEEALRQIWPDAAVEEANLSQNVFTLRKVLGDSPEGAQFIATVPRRGYRFVANVRGVTNGDHGPAPEAAAPPTLEARVHPRAAGSLAWKRPFAVVLAALAVLVLPALGYLAGRKRAEDTPSFRRLTFRRGVVRTARFSRDGRNVVYAASWDGAPSQIFLTRPESPESLPLTVPAADILSVSASGELAVLLRPPRLTGSMGIYGTLARVPLAGGPPRELLDDVQAADWGPRGEALAVVRRVGNSRKRLEYPVGRVLLETVPSDCLESPRVSPGGDFVAYLSCDKQDAPPSIDVVDREGRRRRLFSGSIWTGALAWSPSGSEVWFTAGAGGLFPQLRAVSLSGGQRLITRLPGTLQDVSADGQVLIAVGTPRIGILGVPPGETRERELSWFEGSSASALSVDGRQLLFGEVLEGGGVSGRIYLRGTDGSPAVRMGEGRPLALSNDGRWALVHEPGSNALALLPTGPGEARRVDTGGIRVYSASFFPDGRRLLIGGYPAGSRSGRLYVEDLEGGTPRPITPEQTGVGVLSPDGSEVATIGHDGHFIYPVDGTGHRPFPGPEANEWPIQWSADGGAVYFRREGELPARIVRVEVDSGRRKVWKELAPADPAGVVWMDPIVTPDGSAYAYTYHRLLSDLYLVSGLK